MRFSIQSLKNGDQMAVDAMIDLYYPQIYAFVYRTMCGDEQAKDITQLVFMRFLDHLDRYRDDLDIKAYLFQIAMNACRDHFRNRKRTSGQTPLHEGILDKQDTPHEASMKQERSKCIKRAIDALPFEQRTAVLLRYYHQLKFKEIAEILEVSESTIKSRITLGMEKLRNMLKEDATWMIG